MTTFCNNCGNALHSNEIYCRKCGWQTGQLSSQQVSRQTQPLEQFTQPQTQGWLQEQPQQFIRNTPQNQTHSQNKSQSQDLKRCPFCAELINAAAIKCRFCGEVVDITRRGFGQPQAPIINQNVNVAVPVYQAVPVMPYYPPRKLWSPGVAALLSFLIPGLGQLYKGQVASGILWFIFVLIGYGLFIIPGFILHIICIITAGSGSPYQR